MRCSPVSLQNADKVPSLRDTSKFDIRVSATTQVTTPQKQLTFRYEAPVETQDKIGSLSKLNIYQKVCVQAKVLEKGEPEQITTKLNKTLLKCDAIIGDNTGTIKLTLWEQDISKINATNSYRMTNLTIREFENCKTLTSSYDSTFEQITDIGQIRDDNSQSLTESETVNATLLSVSCSSMNSCVSCKKNLPPLNTDIATVKCLNCGMRQRLTSIHTSHKCEIVCSTDSGQKVFYIPNRVLKSSSITEHLDSIDSIEDALLQHDKITLTLTNAFVTNIVPYQKPPLEICSTSTDSASE